MLDSGRMDGDPSGDITTNPLLDAQNHKTNVFFHDWKMFSFPDDSTVRPGQGQYDDSLSLQVKATIITNIWGAVIPHQALSKGFKVLLI